MGSKYCNHLFGMVIFVVTAVVTTRDVIIGDRTCDLCPFNFPFKDSTLNLFLGPLRPSYSTRQTPGRTFHRSWNQLDVPA